MNSIIVNMLLHLTSGSRFPGSLNMDMNEIATNLVAYPKLQYIFSSVSPTALTGSSMCTTQGTKLIDELFTDAWSRNNQLIKVDPLQAGSKVLSAAHIVRGNCFISDLKRNIEKFQRKITCTEWSRDAMKIGLCSVPPAGHSTSLLCLLNSSSMSLLFKNIIKQFVTLYKRKVMFIIINYHNCLYVYDNICLNSTITLQAHVYHYTQVRGFEEAHFVNSKEIILNLIARYTELENQRPTSISRLQII